MGTVSAEKVEALLRRLCPIYEHIGLQVASVGDELSCTVPLIEANGNHLGGMHAAIQWAAAECLGGVAYTAHPELGRCWVAVRQVTIDFVAEARTDIRAVARFGPTDVAQVAEQLDMHGKAEYALDITICDLAGDKVATATGRYYLRRLDVDSATAMNGSVVRS